MAKKKKKESDSERKRRTIVIVTIYNMSMCKINILFNSTLITLILYFFMFF